MEVTGKQGFLEGTIYIQSNDPVSGEPPDNRFEKNRFLIFLEWI